MPTRTIADVGGNWDATATWGGDAAPTNADDVVATATSGQVTVNQTTCVCKTLDLTGYTNTLTFTAAKVLTVSGSVTLASGMTVAGTGKMTVNAAATLTSAAKTFSGALTLISDVTYTLGDNWTVTGTVTTGGSSASCVINGYQIACNGSWDQAGTMSGTTVILLSGTGNLTGYYYIWYSRPCSNPVTINTSGTLTVVGHGPHFNGCTVTYTDGTFAGTGSFSLSGAVTFAGTWPVVPKIIVFGAATLTIQAAFEITGYLQLEASLTMVGDFALTVGTLWSYQAATLTLVHALTATSVELSANLTMAGNFAVSATTVTPLDTAKLTIASAWTVTTLTTKKYYVLTIAGAFDWSVTNLLVEPGSTLVLPNGVTVTVSTSLIVNGASNYTTTIKNTSGSTTCALTYNGTLANMQIVAATFTYVVAAVALWNYHGGTITGGSGITNFSTTPGDSGGGRPAFGDRTGGKS